MPAAALQVWQAILTKKVDLDSWKIKRSVTEPARQLLKVRCLLWLACLVSKMPHEQEHHDKGPHMACERRIGGLLGGSAWLGITFKKAAIRSVRLALSRHACHGGSDQS